MKNATRQSFAFSPRNTVIPALLLAIGAILASPRAALAQDASWLSNPGSNDWNTGSNWSPAIVPTNNATFGTSGTLNPAITAFAGINNITFSTGGNAFTIGVSDTPSNGTTLLVSGSGVLNNSGTTETFQVNNATFNSANIYFTNNANAAINTNGSTTVYNDNYELLFEGNATAGDAIINVAGSNASLDFIEHSNAGNAVIAASGSGKVYFSGTSTGGNATVDLAAASFLDISHTASGTVSLAMVSGSGDIYLGSNNLTINGTTSGTISGVIQDGTAPLSGPPFGSGTGGSLTKAGSGTLTLNGSNTYSGGTIISAGTIYFNNNAALGSGTITLNDANSGTTPTSLLATAPMNTNNATIGGGAITNNIVVTSQGTGVSTIGTTVFSGGGANGGFTSTDFTGNITLNRATTIQSGNDDRITFSGLISGSVGLLTIDGGARVTMGGTADNTFIGDIEVTGTGTAFQLDGTARAVPDSSNVNLEAGTLFLMARPSAESINALTGSGVVQINNGNNQTLTIGAGNGSGVFAGSIQDGDATLAVTKSGTGTEVFTGANNYTGATTVNGGLLQIDGTIASGTTIVNASGTLGGTGFIGGNVTNGGNVAPGDSPGTLTIAGDYTQTGAGTLTIQISGTGAGQHDLLAVGGNAALAGKLQLMQLNNFQLHPGDKVVFLTTGTGTVSGTFSNVDTGTILDGKVVYDLQDAALVLSQGSFAKFAAQAGLTPNQLAVALNADAAAGDPRAIALINFMNNEALGNLPHDFDLISPDELTSIFQISESFADVQGSNIENRLADDRAENEADGVTVLALREDKSAVGLRNEEGKQVNNTTRQANKWDLFMEGSGDFVRVTGDGNGSGYNFTTGGVTIGADYRVCDHFVIGLMGGYANTGSTLTQGGSVDVNGGKVGIYSTAYDHGFYLNTLAAGGINSYDTHRAGLGGIAQGSTDGAEFDGLIGGGYDLHAGHWTLGPIVSAQYTYVSINGFTEAGSLAPLNLPSQHQDSLRSKAGFKLSYDWKMGNGIAVTPMVTAGWQHEFLSSSFALDSSFANGAGNVFTVNGPALGRDSAVVNAGVNVQWTPRFGTYIYYDGDLGRKNYQLNSVSGGVRLSY